MDDMWLETLENWKKHRGSDERQANIHLLLLLRHTLEKFNTANASSLDRFRYGLEQTIDGTKPEDWASYNLGMAKALNYFLQYQTAEKMKDFTLGALPPLEKKVIIKLAEAPKSTPTEIAHKLDITRQQISNLLRSLRAKQLVDFTEIGKSRWYILTPAGNQAYEQFRGTEESSVSVFDKKQLEWTIELFKRKVKKHNLELKRDVKDLNDTLLYAESLNLNEEQLHSRPENEDSKEASLQHSKSGESHFYENSKSRIAPYLLTKDWESEGVLRR